MAQSWRPGRGQSIDALYAWIVTEPDGCEGVASVGMELFGQTVHVPLVGADIDRIKSHRADAELVRKATGFPVRLVRFAMREDLEELP